MSKIRANNLRGAKLTLAQVRDIRMQYATGRYTQASLGRYYQVSTNTIRSIVNEETWRQVEALPVLVMTPEESFEKFKRDYGAPELLKQDLVDRFASEIAAQRDATKHVDDLVEDALRKENS